MSIKSQRNQIDLPSITIKNQRAPKYVMHRKSFPDAKQGQIDDMSDYVEANLKKTVKPRGGEYR
jgi:hypothetical protein